MTDSHIPHDDPPPCYSLFDPVSSRDTTGAGSRSYFALSGSSTDQGDSQCENDVEKAGHHYRPISVDIASEDFVDGSLKMPKDSDAWFSHLSVDMGTAHNLAAFNAWLRGSQFTPDATMTASDMPGGGIYMLLDTIYGRGTTPSVTDTVPAVFQVTEPTWRVGRDVLIRCANRCDTTERNPYYVVLDAPRPDGSVGDISKSNGSTGFPMFCRSEPVTKCTDTRLQPDMVLLFGGNLTSDYCQARSMIGRGQAIKTLATMVADVALSQAYRDSMQSNDCYVAIKPDLGTATGSKGSSSSVTEK